MQTILTSIESAISYGETVEGSGNEKKRERVNEDVERVKCATNRKQD